MADQATEHVRTWRVAQQDRVLAMAGKTSHYAIEPRGEYVFGLLGHRPMRACRGHEHHLVQPGQLVAWDPSHAHAGAAADDQPWTARLIIVEIADLAVLAGDQETALPANTAFPEPVLADHELSRGFLRLHTALETQSSRLVLDELLSEWLRVLVERFAAPRPTRPALQPRDNRALRLACDYLADRPEHNIGLDELAAAAGIGKFRLVRLFHQHIGLPPHALQIAHRIRIARRLLEAGTPITDAATATGFADQSHLHRHFQRSIGLTPAEYQRRIRRSSLT